MELENTILSQVNWTQKDKCHMFCIRGKAHNSYLLQRYHKNKNTLRMYTIQDYLVQKSRYWLWLSWVIMERKKLKEDNRFSLWHIFKMFFYLKHELSAVVYLSPALNKCGWENTILYISLLTELCCKLVQAFVKQQIYIGYQATHILTFGKCKR